MLNVQLYYISLVIETPVLLANYFTRVPLQEEAVVFADFLFPMLDLNHEKRITAAQALKHSWLDGV